MNVLSDHAVLFLNHGTKPTSDRAKSALLDELKSCITSQAPKNSPYTEEQLDRMQRQSLAAKKAKEEVLEATRKAYETQRAKLRQQAATSKPVKAPAKAPAAVVSPFAKERTSTLAIALHRKIITGENATQALAELKRRGVTYDESTGIYSKSHK